MTVSSSTCKTCERECERRDLPDDLSEHWRAKLLSWPVECRECAAFSESEEKRREAEREARERAQRVRGWQQASGMPPLWQGQRWDELEVRPAHAASVDTYAAAATAARAWGDADLTGVVLVGSIGVAKTRIAATAAWSRLERGPLTWVSAAALFTQLDRKFGSPEYEHALSVVAATTALVLDDLDRVKASERAAEKLYVAIDGRINAGAALFVTANMTLGALAERFPEPHGEAIVSRLASYCETFLLKGDDRRLERRRAV